TGGLALRVHDLAIAVTANQQYVDLGTIDMPAPNTPLRAQTLHGKLAVAMWQPSLDMAFGLAATVAQFGLQPQCTGCGALFTISGIGLDAGAQWLPHLEDFRRGAAVSRPIAGGNVVAQGCMDLSNCDGFILPDKVVSAWRAVAGGAFRFADTAWNQKIAGTFRDEESVTVTADLVVTGPSA